MGRTRGRPNLSSETKFNILQEYRKGTLHKIIQHKYNIHKCYASKLAKAQGIPGRTRLLSFDETSMLLIAYKKGEKVASIAAEFKIIPSTVRRIVKRNGGIMRPAGRQARTTK